MTFLKYHIFMVELVIRFFCIFICETFAKNNYSSRLSISLNSYQCLAQEKTSSQKLQKKSRHKKRFKSKKPKKKKRKKSNLPQNQKNMSRKALMPCKEFKEASIKGFSSYQLKETKAVGLSLSLEYLCFDIDEWLYLLRHNLNKCPLHLH